MGDAADADFDDDADSGLGATDGDTSDAYAPVPQGEHVTLATAASAPWDDSSSDESAPADDRMSTISEYSRPAEAEASRLPAEMAGVGAQQQNGGQFQQTQKVASMVSHVQHLLGQIRSAKHEQWQKRQWCEQEHAHSQLSLRLARATVGDLASQAEEHAEAEVDLQEQLTRIRAAIVAVNETAVTFLRGDTKERKHLLSSKKDQALATRILMQAIAILTDLQASQSEVSSRSSAADLATKALRKAKGLFEAEVPALKILLEEASHTASKVAQGAAITLSALKKERSALEFAKDAHGAERSRCLENHRLYDGEVREAVRYTQDLEAECRINSVRQDDHESVEEARALEDAEK